MIRSAILFLFCVGVLLLAAPFVISSLFIDQRGVLISGHVHSKDERVVVDNSSWTRSLDLSIEYDPPQESSVAFLTATVDPHRFDELKIGDLVHMRYLRREDMPHVPGASALRQLHLLPTARLADQHAWSGLQLAFTTPSTLLIKVAIAVVLILMLWRLARIPLFGWAIAICVLAAISVMVVHEFPTPVPPPQNQVRSTSGTVKSLDRVEWLFRDTHQKGFHADQPIEIVGVQFVPEGRTEPVLAVDLIDAGSIPGLREHAPVGIDYESGAPRTARLRGAGRQFVRRNLRGIAVELVASLAVVLILALGASLLGRGYRRLTQRVRA
jgi:hypothetical protein